MLRRRNEDDDGATGIESERRSIDKGWASLANGTDRTAAETPDRADASGISAEQLRVAYDKATRRAADWYRSRLSSKADDPARGSTAADR